MENSSEGSFEEHVAWCLERAEEFLDQGNIAEAAASYISDMGKHPEGAEKMQLVGALILMHEMGSPENKSPESTRKFLLDFAWHSAERQRRLEQAQE